MSERALRAGAAVLALAGAGVSSYLVYSHYAHVQVACTTGGCETVLTSKYSELAGVPVAVLGLVAYAALLVCALLAGELPALAGAAVSAGGLAFGVYLIVIQVAVLEALCQWCLTSDGLLFLLTLVCGWRFARVLRESRAQLEPRSSFS